MRFADIESMHAVRWDTTKSLYVAAITGVGLTSFILVMIPGAGPGPSGLR